MANKSVLSGEEQEILTDAQQGVLRRLRVSGTKGFSRSDYVVLRTIKQNCRNTVKHFESARNCLSRSTS